METFSFDLLIGIIGLISVEKIDRTIQQNTVVEIVPVYRCMVDVGVLFSNNQSQ